MNLVHQVFTKRNQTMTVYNDQVSQYIQKHFVHETDAQRQVRENSAKLNLPPISIKPEEGQFLQFLVRATGARRVVEIGVLGGYSGTWIARGLPPGGSLVGLEVDPRHAEIARQHFSLAGVAELVEVRVGNAHQLLAEMRSEGPFDMLFIDAEKTGYQDYYEWGLENIRIGGVIVAHNAFRKGSVAGTAEPDSYTADMQRFNRMAAEDGRTISTIFPAGDGMVLAVKTA
jgi:predicted O-methyltransferase YrrM